MDYEIARELKRRLAEVVRLVDFRVFGSKSEKIVETITDFGI